MSIFFFSLHLFSNKQVIWLLCFLNRVELFRHILLYRHGRAKRNRHFDRVFQHEFVLEFIRDHHHHHYKSDLDQRRLVHEHNLYCVDCRRRWCLPSGADLFVERLVYSRKKTRSDPIQWWCHDRSTDDADGHHAALWATISD